jgi:hypothetical protein
MKKKVLPPLLLASAIMMALPAGGARAQSDALDALAEWAKVARVLTHPRCVNCHVQDEHPRWSGPHYGAAREHAFNVKRGNDESGFGNPGLRCTTCHFEQNSPVVNGPPGAPTWHLAPPEMVWFGKSSSEICAQIKDPLRNGDRTLREVAEHVRDDPLVGWGWAPGPGRQPAPGSAAETYRALARWIELGAPCPAN